MMIETKKNHMTIKDFSEIAKRNGLQEGKERAAMLRVFHQLGMLLYFDEAGDDLKDIIVLNP